MSTSVPLDGDGSSAALYSHISIDTNQDAPVGLGTVVCIHSVLGNRIPMYCTDTAKGCTAFITLFFFFYFIEENVPL